MNNITNEQFIHHAKKHHSFTVFDSALEVIVGDNIPFEDLGIVIGAHLDSVGPDTSLENIHILLELDFQKATETTVKIGPINYTFNSQSENGALL